MSSLYQCTGCQQTFNNSDFNNHSCISRPVNTQQRIELLNRLLNSGGCGQAYYDQQMAKLKGVTK